MTEATEHTHTHTHTQRIDIRQPHQNSSELLKADSKMHLKIQKSVTVKHSWQERSKLGVFYLSRLKKFPPSALGKERIQSRSPWSDRVGNKHTEKEKAMWPQRQRLEGRDYQSRNCGNYHKLHETRNGFSLKNSRRSTALLAYWAHMFQLKKTGFGLLSSRTVRE